MWSLVVCTVASPGWLKPSHSHCNSWKKMLSCCPLSLLSFSFATKSWLFQESYSHDLVVCAADVCGCIFEHFWSKTWKDGNQFHLEPNFKVLCREAGEMWTDDDEGPIHDPISHNRLEIWGLWSWGGKEHKQYRDCMLQIYSFNMSQRSQPILWYDRLPEVLCSGLANVLFCLILLESNTRIVLLHPLEA